MALWGGGGLTKRKENQSFRRLLTDNSLTNLNASIQSECYQFLESTQVGR